MVEMTKREKKGEKEWREEGKGKGIKRERGKEGRGENKI